MRVLVVKTSSLGDVLHALPALSDAAHAIPGLRFDWVVEEGFAAIPSWHHAVDEVIPVAMRRWRKSLFSAATRKEWQAYKRRVTNTNYDLVIDAQGLLKSAMLARRARGERHGFDRFSAREGLAAYSYQVTHRVEKNMHAIDRLRQLFAQALGYATPAGKPDYGIITGNRETTSRQLVFLHGTTWSSKLWPDAYWQELISLANRDGYRVSLPWGNQPERERAVKLAGENEMSEVAEPMNLDGMATLLQHAAGAVAVDTGLGHLAAALSLPTVSIYGSTDPSLTGTRGHHQVQLAAEFACAPCLKRECTYQQASAVTPACYQALNPERVWVKLQQLIKEKEISR